MLTSFVLQLFLYFPEDKTEYIPAVFSFAVFLIAAIVLFRVIIKVSNKESQEAKELEDRLKRDKIIKE
ncbi:hypothetical protein [Sutcliffiella halmapala]|uniref:hypothetical protein n=1 Tax=Sutcliffiella halmapala TaxID=79882 RepID=UPI0009954819|nr:hypothetical protein [Sutcliffiella halmapala]